jgi:TATA-binding protein-associated factor Taf7
MSGRNIEGGRYDLQTLVQRQIVLRVLPESLADQVRCCVSGASSASNTQDIQIYRDEEQPSPPFYPASNERMTFQIQNRKYPASLVDLPCPVETYGTMFP